MANHIFDSIPREQWNDWKWQMKNRISDVEELKKYIKLTARKKKV
jgi:Lysine 2,3-aminomutase